ncbi:MAG: A/G-specific adenine glycosylase [Patescibacteria group bacterium]|nr:A/G-specific adenine glycosylase [Patescibacteria group bacterium]
MKTVIDALLAWFSVHGRDLPWRNTQDPYAILVSEYMLQQTQVQRVIPYYHAWMKVFPTWRVLADAPTRLVLERWSGLGYNRRALALQSLAQHVAQHGEPTSPEGWQTLKGIGPYTAAAVSAFSRQQAVLPIDTNIRRLLGRLLLGIPFPTPQDDAALHAATASWLAHPRFFDVPQALFDVAATICKKRPACASCPLQAQCSLSTSFLAGNISIPKRSIKKAQESRHNEKPHPDRIYRGRILKLLRTHTRETRRTIGAKTDPDFDPIADTEWISRMIDRLIKDGLVHEEDGFLKFGPSDALTNHAL